MFRIRDLPLVITALTAASTVVAHQDYVSHYSRDTVPIDNTARNIRNTPRSFHGPSSIDSPIDNGRYGRPADSEELRSRAFSIVQDLVSEVLSKRHIDITPQLEDMPLRRRANSPRSGTSQQTSDTTGYELSQEEIDALTLHEKYVYEDKVQTYREGIKAAARADEALPILISLKFISNKRLRLRRAAMSSADPSPGEAPASSTVSKDAVATPS